MALEHGRTWEAMPLGLNLIEWLRSVMEQMNAKFGSWKVPDEVDDQCGCVDPGLVMALEFIASLFPDEKGS